MNARSGAMLPIASADSEPKRPSGLNSGTAAAGWANVNGT